MVDVSWLGVGAGLQLGDKEPVLQLLHVDGHFTVQVGHHFWAGQTRTKNIATDTEFCGKLEFSPLLVKKTINYKILNQKHLQFLPGPCPVGFKLGNVFALKVAW